MSQYTQEDINAYIAGLKAGGLEGQALYDRLGQEAVNAGVTSSQVAAGLQAAGESQVTQPVVDKYLAERGMQSIADQGVTDQDAINAYVNQSRGLFGDEGELFNFLNQQRIDYGIGDEAMAAAVGVSPEDMYQWLYESGADTTGSSGYGGFTPATSGTTPEAYAAYDKRPEESLTDYYGRLASGRAGGILGTRDMIQGMFPAGTSSIGNEAISNPSEATSEVKGMFEEYFPKANGATSGSGDGSSSVTPIDWSSMNPEEAYMRWQQGADLPEQAMITLANSIFPGMGYLGEYFNDIGSESAAMDWLNNMGAEDLGGWEAFADAWGSWGSDGSGSSDTGFTSTGSNSAIDNSTGKGYSGRGSYGMPTR